MFEINLDLLELETIKKMFLDLTGQYDTYTYSMSEDQKDSDKHVDTLRRAFGDLWLYGLEKYNYDLDDMRYRL